LDGSAGAACAGNDPISSVSARAADCTVAAVVVALCAGASFGALGCGSEGGEAGVGRQAIEKRLIEKAVGDTGRVKRLDQELDSQLKSANLAFSTPSKLRMGDHGLVELRVSTQIPIDILKSELDAAGARAGVQIQASDRMEATLTGGAFKIQDITEPQQAVGARATEWKWEIEPTKAGRLSLHLALTALIRVNGQPTTYGVRTFDRKLTVESVAVPMTKQVTEFLQDNWGWIAGILTLLGGGIGWWLRQRRSPDSEANGRHQPRRDGRHRQAPRDPGPTKSPSRQPAVRSRGRSRASARRPR
jgi:hypothetical protein